MNQEIKQRWVEALRSGDYKQGQGCLHDHRDNTFCCLGVLCDIYLQEHGRAWDNRGSTCAYVGDAHTVPPSYVANWADLPDRNPPCADLSIAEFSDNGVTFTEIANLIEQHL